MYATAQSAAAAAPHDFFTKEVAINDAPPAARAQLTKRSVQEDIQARTQTVIVTKGRYYPPGEAMDGKERPLYLQIRPSAAVGEVRLESVRVWWWWWG